MLKDKSNRQARKHEKASLNGAPSFSSENTTTATTSTITTTSSMTTIISSSSSFKRSYSVPGHPHAHAHVHAHAHAHTEHVGQALQRPSSPDGKSSRLYGKQQQSHHMREQQEQWQDIETLFSGDPTASEIESGSWHDLADFKLMKSIFTEENEEEFSAIVF